MRRIRGWWRAQNRTLWLILIVLLMTAGVSIAVEGLLSGSFSGLGLNLGTEIIGAVLTFALIDRIIGGSEEEKRLRANLIAQMGSTVNEEVKRAVEELRRYGWLRDGTLHHARLRGANLKGTDLREANLEQVDLWDANLEEANLWQANLAGARLWETNCHKANLEGANLEKASLTAACLRNANLNTAILSGADLSLADLDGASFEMASVDEHTLLPDGTKWVSGGDIWSSPDLTRFTDPDHPNFWRSDAPGSPAYRGQHKTEEAG